MLHKYSPSSSTYVPFQVQHLVLKTVQSLLETCGFYFVESWLPNECKAFELTCPESMELHRFFTFLDLHRKAVISVDFHQALAKTDKLRRVVSDIRHAAVHRIMQDRSGFYQKLGAAAEFAGHIGGDQWARMLAHLRNAVSAFLTKMDDRFFRLKDNIQWQIQLCRSHPQKRRLKHRLSLLPEAARRVKAHHERTLYLQVQNFIRRELQV